MLSSSNNLQNYIKGIKESRPVTKLKLVMVLTMQMMRQIVLFLLSLYNVIFIPLQMGFSIAFEGWILYIELTTIGVYFIDAILIYNNLKLLQKKQTQI